MAPERAARFTLRSVIARTMRSMLKAQQRWADAMRAVDLGEAEGTAGHWRMRLGVIVFRALRSVIKPSYRTKIRMWALGEVSSVQTATEPQPSHELQWNKSDRLGVNLIGYLHAENGLGESARSALRALATTNLEIAAIDVRFGCAARKEAEIDAPITQGPLYPINLFHLNPDQLCVAYTMFGPEAFRQSYNIGFCVWEQDELPEDWVPALELVQEIWTPSRFCVDVISKKTRKPVIRIPHNVESRTDGLLDRKALGLPGQGVLFLCMADLASTPERKNPAGALEAYIRAFSAKQHGTFLILKILPHDTRPDVLHRIRAVADQHPGIIVIDRYLSRVEVDSLISACDCFVSLHRAEGFGFPLAEAMGHGKPVVATGWSGNMDFMHHGNSLPVKYTITALDHETGPYRRGARWAEPDLDHAAELMRLVAKDREYATSLGAQAQQDMRTHFSAARVGGLIRDRLNRIVATQAE